METVKIVIEIKMPKPKVNMASLTNRIGQQSFKYLKGFLNELGIEFTEITCRQEKGLD